MARVHVLSSGNRPFHSRSSVRSKTGISSSHSVIMRFCYSLLPSMRYLTRSLTSAHIWSSTTGSCLFYGDGFLLALAS
jgi:hypothetical protein